MRSATETDCLDVTPNRGESFPIPAWLPLRAELRWPTRLPEETIRTALALPVPSFPVVTGARPRFSIVVLTHNQLEFTRLCLASILGASYDSSYELIVVDNGSDDGTVGFLERLGQANPQVRPILNDRNLGFAGGTNQAVLHARGEILVLVNNDTIAPPGWLEALARPLRDAVVGMVGPLTNRSGGENEIGVAYRTYGELVDFAGRVSRQPVGPPYDCAMLPMFCVALRLEVWRRTGPLDQRYERGLFEDDDYCLRLRRDGYRIRVVTDCFVHHFGQVSMGGSDNYAALFRANRERFEQKWGIEWERGGRRRDADYLKMIERLRELVGRNTPPRARIAVVSRGDEEILRLGDRPAVHFMKDAEGVYAGYHPANSGEALRRLVKLRREGTEYLLIPETCRWWLEFYSGLESLLSRSNALVADEPGAGLLYRLRGVTVDGGMGGDAARRSAAR